jgi:mannose-6-phosphate isomerase-like protein (cupin superfamily)
MKNIKKILNNNLIVSNLLQEIDYNDKNTDANWNFNTKRQKIKYHIHTQTIPLIKTNVRQDQGPYFLMPYLENLYPTAYKFIQNLENLLNGKIINAMYVKLFAEQKIYPHKDNQHSETKFYNLHDRYHFNLQGEYELIVEEEKEILYPGDLVLFENTLTHTVNNLKNIDRIALIIDVRK